jgi:hypothetical protein
MAAAATAPTFRKQPAMVGVWPVLMLKVEPLGEGSTSRSPGGKDTSE